MKKIFQLILIFLKIGAFTFGGGIAMIPLIEREVVTKRKWITEKEMLDIIAIAESTPGVIALNTATYVGAKVKGFAGSLAASISVMLPSIIIIILISPFIIKYRDNMIVSYALIGIRASVIVLILNAIIKLFHANSKTLFSYIIIIISLILSTLSAFQVIKLDIVFILIATAIIGIIRGHILRRNKE